MGEPIDIKTKKILPINNDVNFDKAEVRHLLEKNLSNHIGHWTRFQQVWCNNAYKTFKDYEKYLVLIYLFRQIWQDYADKFSFYSMEEFYSKNEIKIDKINLIQIAEALDIPKETVRRKINDFQKDNILTRKGKSIILDKGTILQKPNNSVTLLSKFIEKYVVDLKSQSWFGESLSKEDIELFIRKYFTVAWLRFFKLQIPYLVRHKKTFHDLETWNVWANIALNHAQNFKKTSDQNIISERIEYKNYYEMVIEFKPKHGINASSISDITTIPRATVIRKLKWLNKEKLIIKNKKLEYFIDKKGKKNKKINEDFLLSQYQVSSFLTDIFDLMKNSKFKI